MHHDQSPPDMQVLPMLKFLALASCVMGFLFLGPVALTDLLRIRRHRPRGPHPPLLLRGWANRFSRAGYWVWLGREGVGGRRLKATALRAKCLRQLDGVDSM